MRRILASTLAAAVLVLGGLTIDAGGQGYTGNGNTRAGGPVAAAPALPLTLPNKKGSVRFLAIGDTGTGSKAQHQLAEVMLRYHAVFPYEFVLMMGDNMYGGEKPADFKTKFENVYRELLARKVTFTAPQGINGSNTATFTATLTGTVRSDNQGGVMLDFDNTP